jgi:hypothetical protein
MILQARFKMILTKSELEQLLKKKLENIRNR